MTETPKIIAALIKKAKEEKDRISKNTLLSLYFSDGCKWAKKVISSLIYTDLIIPTDDEIVSLVYQSFEKTLKNIKIEKEGGLSFKNYFYLMIRYQIYSDLKTTLNYRVIPNYTQEIEKTHAEIRQDISSEEEHIKEINLREVFERVIFFLQSKNAEYAEIILLKSQGYKNKEICKQLALTEISLKARLQYIRRLIREEFGQSFFNF
ncbi:hypothetical protein MHSWG343_02460 [Candidatus Mycoplasma haematohominis]|uniref:Uncharacterized protein n=1 Tax=Candidatus Mycoplasma haematohominis TaxID=1494318 RepID=A0A478FTC3_9MOLU|nr:hypothetical protein MHSWG343_02460 [Candidatus Mycoplasma haemohominis]